MSFRVALTFDAEHPDRPHRQGSTGRALDRLAAADVPATFFVQGRWAASDPALARAIATAGHRIGNHSFYHAPMPLLSDRDLAADVRAAERAIVHTTGVDPRPWFRCPFGAGQDDPRVLAALARSGYRHVGWDVDALDWASRATGRGIARRVADDAVVRGDGAIVLLHPWTTATDLGLASLIDALRDRGAAFVRVDDLA
jgi:peptidoglycan/xylan/chitin deacetylase (PgdA/CDA1 family)